MEINVNPSCGNVFSIENGQRFICGAMPDGAAVPCGEDEFERDKNKLVAYVVIDKDTERILEQNNVSVDTSRNPIIVKLGDAQGEDLCFWEHQLAPVPVHTTPDAPDVPGTPVAPTSPDIPIAPTSPDIPIAPTSPDTPVVPISLVPQPSPHGASGSEADSASAHHSPLLLWLSKHRPACAAVLAFLLTLCLVLWLWPSSADNVTAPQPPAAITIDWAVTDALSSEGYLCYSTSDNIKVKCYEADAHSPAPDQQAWDKVRDYIAPHDTLFPKRNCKIFLKAIKSVEGEQRDTVTEHCFDYNAFVQRVIQDNGHTERLRNIALQMFGDVKRHNISFDIGGGVEVETIATADDVRYYLFACIRGNGQTYSIDSVANYPLRMAAGEKESLCNRYPSIKHIRLK